MNDFLCGECGAILDHDDVKRVTDKGDLQTPETSHWRCPHCPSEDIKEFDYVQVAEMLKVLAQREHPTKVDVKNLLALAEIIGEIVP